LHHSFRGGFSNDTNVAYLSQQYHILLDHIDEQLPVTSPGEAACSELLQRTDCHKSFENRGLTLVPGCEMICD
jgi:hypothetical protein